MGKNFIHSFDFSNQSKTLNKNVAEINGFSLLHAAFFYLDSGSAPQKEFWGYSKQSADSCCSQSLIFIFTGKQRAAVETAEEVLFLCEKLGTEEGRKWLCVFISGKQCLKRSGLYFYNYCNEFIQVDSQQVRYTFFNKGKYATKYNKCFWGCNQF